MRTIEPSSSTPSRDTTTSASNLFDTRISMKHLWPAGLVSGALLLVFLLTSAHAEQRAPVIMPFLPSITGVMFAMNLVTCVLLFGQYMASRRLSYLALSAVYAYTSVMVIMVTLTFPGVFSASGLFGASRQTAIWLWVAWHGGYPLGILIYAVIRRFARDRMLRTRSAVLAAVAVGIAVFAVAAVLTDIALRWTGFLPVLLRSDNYNALWTSGVGLTVIGINLAALVTIVWSLRRPTVIQLWVGVATLASFLDVVLTINATQQFTLGWYLARLNSLFASTVVLVSLLDELIRIYYRLVSQQAQIRHLAYHDSLTGLPNRRSFSERLDVQMSRGHEGLMALVVFDLDGFKAVNDTYGHETGDKLLIEVAKRLQSSVREGDTVARFGGDEFLLLLQSAANYADVEAIADRILNNLADPVMIDTHQIHIAASAGIAVYPNAGKTPTYLLRNADTALYRAKRHGRNRFEFYS